MEAYRERRVIGGALLAVLAVIWGVGYASSAFADLTPLPLSDGVPVTGLSGAYGSKQYFVIEVPPDRDVLDISMWGGLGDADLYVRWNSEPTTTVFDYRPYLNGNNETVTVVHPAAGMWYSMIYGYDYSYGYSGVTLKADYTPNVVPLPGAALLGVLGLSVAGWRLRRHERR